MKFDDYLKTKSKWELEEIVNSPIPEWLPKYLKDLDKKRAKKALQILKSKQK